MQYNLQNISNIFKHVVMFFHTHKSDPTLTRNQTVSKIMSTLTTPIAILCYVKLKITDFF